MRFQKQFEVQASPDRVWAFIRDPERFGPCIPGCKRIELLEPGHFRATIEIKVGPIKTVFVGVAEMREQQPPVFAAYSIRASDESKASHVNAVSKLTVVPRSDNRCDVGYVADVNISGRLGKFGAGVVQKLADSLSSKMVEAMRVALEAEEAGALQANEASSIPRERKVGWVRRLMRWQFCVTRRG